jgi:hypothetical protein
MMSRNTKMDLVPTARRKAFRALRLFRLESIRALKTFSQIGAFYGPKTLKL